MLMYASPVVGGFQDGHRKANLLLCAVPALCRNTPCMHSNIVLALLVLHSMVKDSLPPLLGSVSGWAWVLAPRWWGLGGLGSGPERVLHASCTHRVKFLYVGLGGNCLLSHLASSSKMNAT